MLHNIRIIQIKDESKIYNASLYYSINLFFLFISLFAFFILFLFLSLFLYLSITLTLSFSLSPSYFYPFLYIFLTRNECPYLHICWAFHFKQLHFNWTLLFLFYFVPSTTVKNAIHAIFTKYFSFLKTKPMDHE